MDKIYLITTATKLNGFDSYGYLDIGSHRSVGWYDNFEKAEQCVINNTLDIWETCYDYAIIEEIEIGIYPCLDYPLSQRKFYKYNMDKDKYEPLLVIPKEYADYVLPIASIG